MSAVSIDNLVKTFGEVTALDDLSLTVDEGEFFGLLGPNGAGKTTTLSILSGQLRADSGDISVLGLDPSEQSIDVRSQLGLLPEKESPPSFLTPREYFRFVGDIRGLDRDTVDERAAEWAERLAFEEKLDTLCADLSRGQQQKTMVTQAFIHEPELVIIDEPLANLDPMMQERVKDHLREYHAAGNTLIISTHHIEVAADLCERVGVIDGGELVTTEPLDDSDGELLDTFIETVDEAGDS